MEYKRSLCLAWDIKLDFLFFLMSLNPRLFFFFECNLQVKLRHLKYTV